SSDLDLANYHAVWREPIVGTYKDYKIISMPPPSSGGVALVALLQSVEQYPLHAWGFQSDSTVRAMEEAERRIYADRASYLGDPDFYNVPVQYLTDKKRNQERMAKENLAKATPSDVVTAITLTSHELEETSHFRIVEKDRNAVSIPTAINGSYGVYVWVDNAGFLLNNEIDDFSIQPGTPN